MNENSYEYDVGNIRVSVISDGHMVQPLTEGQILNAPLAEVKEALRAAGLPTDTLTTTFAPLVLRTGSQRVVIDTGLGPDVGQEPGSTAGQFVRNMQAKAIDPRDIDVVVISHFHGDHVNGLMSRDSPVFPHARILVPEPEWQFWTDDAEMKRAPVGRMAQLFANNRRVLNPLRDRVELYKSGDEVVPGLQAVATYGHSLGHMSFWLRSGGERLYIQSDISNQAALFLPHPDWQSPLDQFPEDAVKVRRQVYDMLARDRVPLQAFHHTFPGRSYLELDGSGYRRVSIG